MADVNASPWQRVTGGRNSPSKRFAIGLEDSSVPGLELLFVFQRLVVFNLVGRRPATRSGHDC
jgi:hypothetical protein